MEEDEEKKSKLNPSSGSRGGAEQDSKQNKNALSHKATSKFRKSIKDVIEEK